MTRRTELEIEMHKLQRTIRHEDLTLEQARVCLDALYEVMCELGDSNVDTSEQVRAVCDEEVG